MSEGGSKREEVVKRENETTVRKKKEGDRKGKCSYN